MGFFSSSGFQNIISPATKIYEQAKGFLGDPLGTQATIAGLRSAGRIEEAAQLEAQQRAEQIFGETAGFRELAREQIPLLREEALAEPGTSPLFQRGLQRGITGIQTQLAARGLADSSTAGLAIGELGASLLAQDIGRISGLRTGLAGLGTVGFGLGLQGQSLASQLALARAQTAAGIGAARGAGRAATTGLFLNLLGQAGGAFAGTPTSPLGTVGMGGGAGGGGLGAGGGFQLPGRFI